MMLKPTLRRDNRGIGAVEFALVAPVLLAFVIGVSQLGRLFFANADMKNAMAHGARVASVWPVPDDATVLAAVNERIQRTRGLAAAQVAIERDQDGIGNDFLEIEMSYQVPLDFIFFDVGSVTLNDTRKVFIQMDGTVPQNNNGGTTTTSTTSGGTTSSTSATSAGGTDTSTSASSTGGDTSTTSASTSSSTTSSTTSSGNGNSNGNSSHGHGNCNKKC